MFIRNAISKFKADFDEVDFFPSPPILRPDSDRSSSQTTSNDGSSSRFRTSLNAVSQNPVTRDDLPPIPSESSEDEDNSNGQLQKRNLFQSLQHNPSHVSPNASSLSIKSGTSSQAQQSDSSKLNTTTEKPRESISSNNSIDPPTYSNYSEISPNNPFIAKTPPPHPKRDAFAKAMMSAILRPKESMKFIGTHHDTTNDFAQPVTTSKSPVEVPSVTSSSNTTTNGNVVSSTPQEKEMPKSISESTSDSVEVVVYPKEHLSSTTVPMIQSSVTQTSRDDSVTHNDGNLDSDDQQNTSETNNRPDSTPITQSPSSTSKKLPEREIATVREISEDFALDKPSTSPNIQSPPLYSTTTDGNLISPKDNSPVRKVEARGKPDMNPLLNLATPNTRPPHLTLKKLPERDIAFISELSEDFASDKPSTSLNVQSPPLSSAITTSPDIQTPPLNSTTTDSNAISPKDNSPTPKDDSPVRKVEAIRKPDMNPFLNLATPNTRPPHLTLKKLPERDIAFIRELCEDFASDKPSTSLNIQSPPLNSAITTSPDIQTPSLNSTTTDSNAISPKNNSPVRKVEATRRRKPDTSSFLLKLVAPQAVSKEVPEKVQPPTKTQPWRSPLLNLQSISESGDSLPSDDFTPAPDDILARKMEDLGRLRRMESRNLLAQSKTSPETLPSRTTATPKAELRPQLQTLQEDNSSEVATLLREAYKERQQTLQAQLDKAQAALRDVQAENKRLSSENQAQQRSISELKIALGQAKHEQENSVQINNQLRVATSSLTALNKEKKGWQDKLDSMQHKLSAAERQVRCLDHLTRHKLESRQEAGYGQPKRRGQSSSIPASTDVIGAMRALNEEIYQTCVQLVEGLERTALFSTSQKPQVRKVLGDYLTAMLEDQAKKKANSGGYNMLLMQTVLEVFMTHWCSSIIEAFYPQQESFADLLVELSAQTAKTSGLTAICGKQIKIIQSSTHHDSVKFNQWVNDIIKELGLFLTIAGLRMKTQYATLFSTKTLALVKVAYDLRTAMAEKDICGDLEIVIVPPDTPFQEKWMIDAHADPRKADTDQSRVDYVTGTTAMGLQRKVSGTVDGQFQSRMEIELKPKVTLAHALKSQQELKPKVGLVQALMSQQAEPIIYGPLDIGSLLTLS